MQATRTIRWLVVAVATNLLSISIVTIMLIVVVPATADTINWNLYDDFTGGTLDTTKWHRDDPLLLADVIDGEARLSITQPEGYDDTDPGMNMTNSQGINIAVKADMKLLSTSTGAPYDAIVKMMVAINSPNGVNTGYDATFYLMKSPTSGEAIIEVEFEDNDSGNRWDSQPYAAQMDTYYTFGIVVAPDAIDFYLSGVLFDSYIGQNDVLAPGNYAITGVGFESRTYNLGEFVDARVDNVYTAVPEPATLAFLGLGALGLVARRRSKK